MSDDTFVWILVSSALGVGIGIGAFAMWFAQHLDNQDQARRHLDALHRINTTRTAP
jgi:uncharacterized membrane-anchored protein YhcB (DUF1043 family)